MSLSAAMRLNPWSACATTRPSGSASSRSSRGRSWAAANASAATLRQRQSRRRPSRPSPRRRPAALSAWARPMMAWRRSANVGLAIWRPQRFDRRAATQRPERGFRLHDDADGAVGQGGDRGRRERGVASERGEGPQGVDPHPGVVVAHERAEPGRDGSAPERARVGERRREPAGGHGPHVSGLDHRGPLEQHRHGRHAAQPSEREHRAPADLLVGFSA